MARIFVFALILGAVFLGVSIYNGDLLGGPADDDRSGEGMVTEPEEPRRLTAEEVLQQYGTAPAQRHEASASSAPANARPRRGTPGDVRQRVTDALAQSERRASGVR